MLDISWTEFALIAVVALVFIGPKELPAVLRTVGQYTRKIRSMAAEFQSQFQEAMREAEMSDLKKQVDDIKNTTFDPLKDVRSEFSAMKQDFDSSLDAKRAPAEGAAASPAEPPATPSPEVAAAPAESPAAPAPAEPAPAAAGAAPDTTGRPA